MKEHKKKVEALFEGALALTAPDQRAAYLERECGGDATLREEVEGLLRAAERAGGFLTADTQGETSPPLHKVGDRIGGYKLLQQIGGGGCGVVFMAEQEQPVRRRVALKIIKPGMDTKQVIARFEAERQALALMDHPNIAKIFDAGTTGRPGGVESQISNLNSEIRNRRRPGLDRDEVPGEGPGATLRDGQRVGGGPQSSPQRRTGRRPPAQSALRVPKVGPATQGRVRRGGGDSPRAGRRRAPCAPSARRAACGPRPRQLEVMKPACARPPRAKRAALKPPPRNFPPWLLSLAEVLSGQTLNQQGALEPTGLNRPEKLRQIQEQLEQQPGDDDWAVWGRWLFADHTTRTISPFAKITVPDYIERLLQEKTRQSLDEAEQLAAGKPEILQRIANARAELKQTQK